jgi:hypothetical protein
VEDGVVLFPLLCSFAVCGFIYLRSCITSTYNKIFRERAKGKEGKEGGVGGGESKREREISTTFP